MREIEVRVRESDAERVARLADEHGALASAVIRVVRGGEIGWRAIHASVPNEAVGRFITEVASASSGAEFVLRPQGVLALRGPLDELRDPVKDVSSRSSFELVLDAMQSIGSWKGLLLYAIASGAVAAYGVLFNVPWLLTAAMLIAPMGAPAMVCVVGVAIGDVSMLRRGSLRFVVSLIVTAAAAALVGLLYQPEVSSSTMELIASLSSWTVLLSLVGGAAGAMALVQSDRDSMVTATATGFLVAVALSPPSAVLGVSVTLARWDYAGLMGFTLLLTFFGILSGGWLAMRTLGVRANDPMAAGGRSRLSLALAATAVLGTAALVGWQTRQEPTFQKSDLASSAVVLTRDALTAIPAVRLVEANARFTRQEADWHAGEGLLLTVVVQRVGADQDLATRVRAVVSDSITATMPGVRPFVDVTVLP